MEIRYIFGIFCTLVLVHGHEISEEAKKLIDECVKETGLPEEAFQESLNFDDPKTKCFLACFMKKRGTLKNGKINVEKEIELATKHIPEGAQVSLKDKIKDCAIKANEEKDECDLAGILHKCAFDKFKTYQPKKT